MFHNKFSRECLIKNFNSLIIRITKDRNIIKQKIEYNQYQIKHYFFVLENQFEVDV